MKVSTNSLWLDTLPKSLQKNYPLLKKDISVDVCIIGGGLTGISTAYLLNQQGISVAVLEKGTYKDSVTAYTTAFLTHVIDTNLQDLVKMFGKQDAKLIWQSHQDAIDLVEKIVEKEKIDCEFMRCDDYSMALEDKDLDVVKKEAHIAQKLGFDDSFVTKANLGLAHKGYLRVPRQAKFHPMKYLQTLKQICVDNGVQLFEQTEATKVKRDDEVIRVTTKQEQTITAKDVIIATYDPFNHPLKLFGKRGMYTSYIMAADIPTGRIQEGIYEDQANPYNYWRVDKKTSATKDRLLLGGQDHRHELPIDEEKKFAAVKEVLNNLLPDQTYTITHQWSGPILEPTDGVALIGKLHEHLYVAMAFSGNGMTYAHISALLLTDLIIDKKNAWEDIYNPTRIPTIASLIQKGIDYTEELFGGAMKKIM